MEDKGMAKMALITGFTGFTGITGQDGSYLAEVLLENVTKCMASSAAPTRLGGGCPCLRVTQLGAGCSARAFVIKSVEVM